MAREPGIPGKFEGRLNLVYRSDVEAEYQDLLRQTKELYKEFGATTPKDLQLRLHQKIIQLANQLVMLDVPRHRIVYRLYEDLEHLYSDRHIRRILEEDPEYSGQLDEPAAAETEAAAKTDIMSENNSSYICENARWIEHCEKEIHFWTAFQALLKKQHFNSLIPAEKADEGYYLMQKSVENCRQEIDGRQDVSERGFPALVVCSLSAKDKAVQLYINHVKEWVPLTGKQYSKIMRGLATICHPFFDPKDQKEAWELGFYGVRCDSWICELCHTGTHTDDLQKPAECRQEIIRRDEKGYIMSKKICGSKKFHQCTSWRVRISSEPTPVFTVHCCACKTDFRPKTGKLPFASQQHIIDNADAGELDKHIEQNQISK